MTENRNNDIEIDIWLEEFLTGLLDKTGLDIWVSEMDINENTNTYTVQLDGDDKARAIGRDGQMINAIQHICISAAANMGIHNVKILLDVDGYRNRRDNKIEQDAQAMIDDVLQNGTPLDMEPMNARDRRLVHMMVSKVNGLNSESFGQGRDRFVRLIPVK
ncbi:MAG: KH domain-containing protein [Deltaproteobacteria bacterium]|nr:KH domain-containing protein [Deltaproteobacteria bacterium]